MNNSNYYIYKNQDRGQANYGWLDARFSFSFGPFFDPSRIQYGPLRVLNNDIIAPKSGFDFHSHQNMEIVTIILEGELTHQDNFEHKAIIKKGDVQVMSAGTGITHSEKNESSSKTELFQLWFLPSSQNTDPSYQDYKFNWHQTTNQWNNLISPKLYPQKNSLQINQSVFLSIGIFDKNTIYETFLKQRSVYLMVINGQIKIDNTELSVKDAISIDCTDKVNLEITETSSVMIIEMPKQDISAY